ncbi:monooxygenase, partial [Actinospica acidiphila]
RRAVRAARLNVLTTGRAGTAVRNSALAALSKVAPSLFLRGFDGVADWRPPGGPSGADGDGSGAPRKLAADHTRRGPEENTP